MTQKPFLSLGPNPRRKKLVLNLIKDLETHPSSQRDFSVLETRLLMSMSYN